MMARWHALSWSWISIRCPASYPNTCASMDKDLDPEIQVLDAKCIPLGLDPTGEVPSWFVLLQGLLCRAMSTTSLDGAALGPIIIGGFNLTFWPDFFKPDRVADPLSKISLLWLGRIPL
jgi:hypothetical protein